MAKDLTAALHALTEAADGQTTRVDRALPAVKVPAAIPARVGSSGVITGASGGIASPLVETLYADRTFHAATSFASTDGIFIVELKPVKTIAFKDANLATVVMEYKAKT